MNKSSEYYSGFTQYEKQILIHYIYSTYYNGNKRKGKALVDSYRHQILFWEDFQKAPPRTSSKNDRHQGKMMLSARRIKEFI